MSETENIPRAEIALLLELVGPGAGLLYIHRWRAGIAMIAAMCVCYALAALAIWHAPMVALVIAIAFILARIVMIAVTYLSARRTSPRPPAIASWITITCALASMGACNARTLVVESFKTASTSMAPTIGAGDQFFVWKLGKPHPGDIIAFKESNGEVFVKRLVAGPGQTVTVSGATIAVDGRLLATGDPSAPFELDERSDTGWTTKSLIERHEQIGDVRYSVLTDPETRQMLQRSITLGPDELYVLGDNRDHTWDSRSFGPIERKQIIGRVVSIWLTVAKTGLSFARARVLAR